MNMRASLGLLSLRCVFVKDETPTVRTFRLRHPDGPVPYVAGQALVLNVPLPDGPVWRSFTVSGGTDGDLELTIKAQSDGGATRWLHDNLGADATIDARAPRGDFTLARRTQPQLAFVSAGSGVTPMMAMLRELAQTEPDADIAWFHAARDRDEVLFADELAAMQRLMPNLTVAVTISTRVPGWFGFKGRLTRRLMSAAIPDFGRREVFCCGPTGFMEQARLIHAAEGGMKAGFHTESFGADLPAAALTPVAAPASGATYQLTVNGRALALSPEETLLQASLRQGVIIPCGCGEGRCGTCMVRLVSGKITANLNGGLTDEEAEQGYILACSSRASSDVEISLG